MIRNIFILFIIFVLSFGSGYSQTPKLNTDKTIKIGLLVTDAQSAEAQNGAALAVEMAGKHKNDKTSKYELVIRSMEGPWGTGSKEAVKLVFDEKVWAILGSHDSRNAHLVEQVIAKTHVVFLSAWACDPTLYQAFVPWFFSIVPNDLQQAGILNEVIIQKNKFHRIVTLSDKSYDAGMALKSFIKESDTTGNIKFLQLFYDQDGTCADDLLNSILTFQADAVVLFGSATSSQKFIEYLRRKKQNIPVFTSLEFLSPDRDQQKFPDIYNKLSFVSTDVQFTNKDCSFAKKYYQKYGKYPGAVAAFAFDGINTIIKAIENSGYKRERMLKSMQQIHYQGITGSVRFDVHGNRVQATGLYQIIDGEPVRINK